MIIQNTKYCKKCDSNKPITSEFFRIKRDGKPHSYCRKCLSKINREQYRLDIEFSRKRNNEYKRSISLTKPKPLEKRCCKCKITYSAINFYPNKHTPDGLYPYCKECARAIKRKECKTKRKLFALRWRIWRNKNKDKINEYQKTNINQNIKRRIRCRIWTALKKDNEIKNKRTLYYTGCDYEFLKNHLIEQYKKYYNQDINLEEFVKTKKYAIDHIIPYEAFDFSSEEARLLCFNYTNLQILKAVDNDLKSDFLPNIFRARYLIYKIKNKSDFDRIKEGLFPIPDLSNYCCDI